MLDELKVFKICCVLLQEYLIAPSHLCSKKRKEREDAGTEVGFLSTFPTICWIKRLKESLKRDVLPRQQIKLMAPVYSNYLFKGLIWNQAMNWLGVVIVSFYAICTFLAPTGVQGMLICVCAFVCLFSSNLRFHLSKSRLRPSSRLLILFEHSLRAL